MSAVIAWVLKHPKDLAAVGIVALILGTGVYIQHLKGEIADREQIIAQVGLTADSLEAELDTTRLVGEQYRRRALQTEIERDALAEELEERPVVEVPITVDPVVVEREVEATRENDVVSARFEDEHVFADVAIDISRDPPVANWLIDVKPVVLTVGVRCGAPNETTGVSSVQVTVEAESLPVQIGLGTVDPGVCNPQQDKGGGGPGLKTGIILGVLGAIGLSHVL